VSDQLEAARASICVSLDRGPLGGPPTTSGEGEHRGLVRAVHALDGATFSEGRMSELVDVLLAALPPDWRGEPTDRTALERAVAAALATARAAWPGVEVADDVVLALVAEHVAAGDRDASVSERFSRVVLADLYIGCACAAGSTPALRAFEARYFGALGPVLSRVGADPTLVDEVRQILREKLFVARPGHRPRVLDLVGHGELGGLIRVAAMRTALNLRRSTHRLELVDHPSVISGVVLGAPSEGNEVIQQLGREQVELAFEEAIAALEVRDRNVLRMHLLHGLSIDEIGRVHGAHRATAARWLERIREQLRAETVRRLRTQLGLPADEVESLIRFVQSRIEVSYARLLES
jgi:RNA polymerase sigma-70 factor (ECF subfamily)